MRKCAHFDIQIINHSLLLIYLIKHVHTHLVLGQNLWNISCFGQFYPSHFLLICNFNIDWIFSYPISPQQRPWNSICVFNCFSFGNDCARKLWAIIRHLSAAKFINKLTFIWKHFALIYSSIDWHYYWMSFHDMIHQNKTKRKKKSSEIKRSAYKVYNLFERHKKNSSQNNSNDFSW